jgi:hypothetical protein
MVSPWICGLEVAAEVEQVVRDPRSCKELTLDAVQDTSVLMLFAQPEGASLSLAGFEAPTGLFQGA